MLDSVSAHCYVSITNKRCQEFSLLVPSHTFSMALSLGPRTAKGPLTLQSGAARGVLHVPKLRVRCGVSVVHCHMPAGATWQGQPPPPPPLSPARGPCRMACDARRGRTAAPSGLQPRAPYDARDPRTQPVGSGVHLGVLLAFRVQTGVHTACVQQPSPPCRGMVHQQGTALRCGGRA